MVYFSGIFFAGRLVSVLFIVIAGIRFKKSYYALYGDGAQEED
jgi:hypothetical protein